jgi:hypothetical protein
VLRVEGLLMFSCFGPDTLREVRSAFEQIDLAPHTLPFVDMHDFGDMLVNAGFSTPVMDMETITVTYEPPAPAGRRACLGRQSTGIAAPQHDEPPASTSACWRPSRPCASPTARSR